ncbi:acyltransferase 3 [Rhizorhabdus wittichii RW1]|uniref:Acyltransferase 3 n=1 Tax=Rhizorhabdus wittichii (strain DSM 6014 / CCUG 31198 / JCM 15750 / NBRC 105917 / EY 4224 / RW1) TaxID=392499 RepID=A0A9J9HFR7_RHIWR|nr:acyltransferase 3 [Rhizorhabdus wittichii RW1]
MPLSPVVAARAHLSRSGRRRDRVHGVFRPSRPDARAFATASRYRGGPRREPPMEPVVTRGAPAKYRDVDMLRGYAALAVALYHFLLAYVPPGRAPVAMDQAGLIAERPFLLAIVNGHFMVAIFFVLSSFVLTKGLVSGTPRSRALAAMAKRLPRLLPLTLIGTLLPFLLFAAGLLPTQEAAQVSGSEWLDRSGGIKYWAPWPEPGLTGAAKDALHLFASGVSQYNSALWTMKYELFGSLLALLGAMIIGARRRPVLDAVLITILAIAALEIHALCAICVTTVYVAKYLLDRPADIGPAPAAALIAAGLLLGSTFKSIPPSMITDDWMWTQVQRLDWIVHGIGATALLLGMRGLARLREADWWIGRQLGRLSFAIYVIHVPLQSAIGSQMMLALGHRPVPVIAAFFLSMTVIFMMAAGVARIDELWVARLNRVFAPRPRPAGQAAAASSTDAASLSAAGADAASTTALRRAGKAKRDTATSTPRPR